MLSLLDKELGYPQIYKRNMGTEVWSTDYYGVDGSGATTIEEIQAQINANNSTIEGLYAQIAQEKAKYAEAAAKWQSCAKSDCKDTHSADRCNRCRGSAGEIMNAYSTKVNSISDNIHSIKAVNAELKGDLAKAQVVVQELAEASTELAKFGQTPEGVYQGELAKAKNKRLIIIAAVGVGLLFTTIAVIAKVRKKKK